MGGCDGIVKWFDLHKGFGFIEITSGKDAGGDIFVHATDVRGNPLRENDKVEFDIGDDRNGAKKRAMDVSGGTGSFSEGKGKGKGGYNRFDRDGGDDRRGGRYGGDGGRYGGDDRRGRDDWGGRKGGYDNDRKGGDYGGKGGGYGGRGGRRSDSRRGGRSRSR